MFVLQVCLSMIEPNHRLKILSIICCLDQLSRPLTAVSIILKTNKLVLFIFKKIRTRHTQTHPISPMNSRNLCWTVITPYYVQGAIEGVVINYFREYYASAWNLFYRWFIIIIINGIYNVHNHRKFNALYCCWHPCWDSLFVVI